MVMHLCKLVLCPLDLHLPLPVDMHGVLFSLYTGYVL